MKLIFTFAVVVLCVALQMLTTEAVPFVDDLFESMGFHFTENEFAIAFSICLKENLESDFVLFESWNCAYLELIAKDIALNPNLCDSSDQLEVLKALLGGVQLENVLESVQDLLDLGNLPGNLPIGELLEGGIPDVLGLLGGFRG